MLTGFFNHASKPISPLTAYISNINIENAMALSLLSPRYEKRMIIITSLVPIPDIDIGIDVMSAEIETQATR